jgi:hypothetical protein
MNTAQETRTGTTGQRYPISNFLYDVITLMHERCKGLEALQEYRRDASGHDDFLQLLQKIQQQDEQCVRELQKILAKNVTS